MIKIYNNGNYPPTRGTDQSAGLDLYANSFDGDFIGTGIHVELPENHVGLIVPRSSAGLKGFKLANTVGVIDADYRGEIKLARDYHPTKGFYKINIGDKLAQLVVVPVAMGVCTCQNLSDLSDTARGDGGFGSTGG